MLYSIIYMYYCCCSNNPFVLLLSAVSPYLPNSQERQQLNQLSVQVHDKLQRQYPPPPTTTTTTNQSLPVVVSGQLIVLSPHIILYE